MALSSEFRLTSERLAMRWLTLADAELMLAVWNDPAFVRHVGDRGIRSIAEAEETLRKGAFKLYDSHGFGPYRVALACDDTPIGTCGLFLREGYDEPDLGYSILPPYCRNGYAYEAACAVIDYARRGLQLPRITAFISPGNAASIGLAQKLGFRFERLARLAGDAEDICLYGMSLQQ